MKTTIYNLLLAGIFSGLILAGCSKSEAVNDLNNNPQTLKISNGNTADDGTTDMGMLNRDLGIVYATDGKTNMSDEFANYTFRLKGTQPRGQMLVSTGQSDQMGTWSWRGGSDVIVMDFSNSNSDQLTYLHQRPWTIQPATSANTIRMVAPDGDQIVMSGK